MTFSANDLSARNLAAAIRAGRIPATQVIGETLDRVARVNPAINAIVQDCGPEALAEAEALDARIRAGEAVGALAGVPVTIKVISDQKGYATTNGTTLARDLIATRDSPVVRHLRAQGAIVVGRTNCPAFSYRWFSSNRIHGTTANPHNPGLTPGGSSGGAGAATAAGLGHIAHGTDIAGSVRYPAYACGVQGLRPTPGRVPMFNPSGSDRAISPQITAVCGPLARRVDDLRLGLMGMQGYAPEDPWSTPTPPPGPALPRRVALIRNPGGMATDPRIDADLDRACAILRAAGWEVTEPADVPDMREAKELQTDFWLADAHDEKLAAAEAEGDPGALALLRFYADRAAALDVGALSALFLRRSALVRAWRAFVTDYPVVLTPVSGELPFRQDEDLEGPEAIARLWEAQLPQIAVPFLGLPAVSVCSGIVDNVPCGVHLIAPPWREDVCLDAAEVLEQAFGVPEVVPA